jgi:hypothetical protein
MGPSDAGRDRYCWFCPATFPADVVHIAVVAVAIAGLRLAVI